MNDQQLRDFTSAHSELPGEAGGACVKTDQGEVNCEDNSQHMYKVQVWWEQLLYSS